MNRLGLECSTSFGGVAANRPICLLAVLLLAALAMSLGVALRGMAAVLRRILMDAGPLIG
ncbi:hypothetical protein [Corynebacterium alimapuense]|uniref:hypothetical protein n=1 Tax=Corynebacterium alimapuense TaxID=1576874 RepID=UPI000F8013DF|nr:hypothetical protein [Corynebacterium alimapuense]